MKGKGRKSAFVAQNNRPTTIQDKIVSPVLDGQKIVSPVFDAELDYSSDDENRSTMKPAGQQPKRSATVVSGVSVQKGKGKNKRMTFRATRTNTAIGDNLIRLFGC
jgi:hypothetical protein